MRLLAAILGLLALCTATAVGLRAYRAVAQARSRPETIYVESVPAKKTPPPPKPAPPPPPPPKPAPPPPPPHRSLAEHWLKAKAITLELPTKRLPIPTPLPPERAQPGFRIRGIKGLAWTPEQYLPEIPVMAKYKLNFLMNCYLTLYRITGPGVAGLVNEWWLPLPAEKREGLERVVQACKDHGIEFCFSMNPAFLSPRPLRYEDPQDVEALWQHYDWMQGLGVKWFSLALDDVPQETQAKAQAGLANDFLVRLRARDPDAQLIFCPSIYWGEGGPGHAYLVELGKNLAPDIYVFWTGHYIYSNRVTRGAAAAFRRFIPHKLIFWDNLCDDVDPHLMLGPVWHAPDLCEQVEGYMMNSHRFARELNRIPMLTVADYAYNPWDYDPARAIGQAILHMADTPAQREALRELVEAYPGRWYTAGIRAPFRSPLIKRFYDALGTVRPPAIPEGDLSEAAEALWRLRDLAERFAKQFPGRYAATKEVLATHLDLMQQAYDHRVGCWPPNQGPPRILW